MSRPSRVRAEAAGVEFVAATEALPTGSFDVAISHHSLEHVPDPRAVLVELRLMVKPGGRLLRLHLRARQRRYRRFASGGAQPPPVLVECPDARQFGDRVGILRAGTGRSAHDGYDRRAARAGPPPARRRESGFECSDVSFTSGSLHEVVMVARPSCTVISGRY